MINLYNGGITDIMPDNLKSDPVAQAISYAISNTVKQIIDTTKQSSVYAAVDILEEALIDLLAVELRTKYYSDTFTMAEKREMIKRTLPWYYKAGTLSTVKELTDFVFQSAEVEEWFQYEGNPYLFRLMVNIISQDMTLEKYLGFLQSLRDVKNTRSHLKSIIWKYHTKTISKTVAAGGIGCCIKIKARLTEEIQANSDDHVSATLRLSQHIKIKGRDEIGPNDVYVLAGSGKKVRVLSENGRVVRTTP